MDKVFQRKDDHIEFSLQDNCRSSLKNGFEKYRFNHRALPELDFSEIDTSIDFLKKKLSMPLIISSITGGGNQSKNINIALAELAEEYKIGFAAGSQRIALESGNYSDFQLRKYAPKTLMFANLGAVQLNYGFGLDQCKAAVDMLEADALFLHLNSLQEIFQKEGNRNFSNLLKKIENICKNLEVPVIAKEIGYGISSIDAKKLYKAGVKIVDVAGAGSVSWSSIESSRCDDEVLKDAAETFRNWGNSTADCIEDISIYIPRMKIIASGGINNGVDIAKAISLGAEICGNASIFLKKIKNSRKSCENFIKTLHLELKTAMFCTGSENIQELKKVKLIKY